MNGHEKYENFLIEMSFLEGEEIKVELGEIYEGRIKINQFKHEKLIGNILILKDNQIKNSNTFVSFKRRLHLMDEL